MIANINHVKTVLGEKRAKKKLGQNFLIDANIVGKIAREACDKDLKTIEIGPGLGALTECLLKYSLSVDAYEIDPEMYEILNHTIDDEHLKVYLQDFLDADLGIYQEKVNIAANLPYYVTTPILFKIFESDLVYDRITVMIQKEVADRILAEADTEDYGALSVETAYLFDVHKLMDVSRKAFYPEPGVDSSVVVFALKRARNRLYEESLFTLVKNCFRMRRKTLHNNLKDLFPLETIQEAYASLGFKENIRAQELTLDQFIALHDKLYER
ncbi:MAG: ribosomal RNA small subunit methyltransferase A [Erysipelotrichaceae bacterium]|nr:ribosomal RNA small subunit methyltransferase A [Erysipelotrichaceae bacterium]